MPRSTSAHLACPSPRDGHCRLDPAGVPNRSTPLPRPSRRTYQRRRPNWHKFFRPGSHATNACPTPTSHTANQRLNKHASRLPTPSILPISPPPLLAALHWARRPPHHSTCQRPTIASVRRSPARPQPSRHTTLGDVASHVASQAGRT